MAADDPGMNFVPSSQRELYGFMIGSSEDPNIIYKLAQNAVVSLKRNLVPLEKTPNHTPYVPKLFTFSSASEVSNFMEKVGKVGLTDQDMAQAEFDHKQWESGMFKRICGSEANMHQETSNCFVHLKCFMHAKGSFTIDRALVQISEIALKELECAEFDAVKAKEFLLKYGSHLNFGTYSMGGILFQKTAMETSGKVALEGLKALVDVELREQEDDGESKKRFTIDGFVVVKMLQLDQANGVRQTFEFKITSQAVTHGPDIDDPPAFRRRLDADTRTWRVIRSCTDPTSAVPIWEIVETCRPDEPLQQPCSLLKETWLAETADCKIDWVVQERRRVQGHGGEQLATSNSDKDVGHVVQRIIVELQQLDLQSVEDGELADILRKLFGEIPNLQCFEQVPDFRATFDEIIHLL